MRNIYFIIAVFCFISFVQSCAERESNKDKVVTVKVDTVRTNGEKSFLQYPGRVKAAQDVDISFRVSGKIQSINVKEGDSVRKGQLLASLDPSDYKVQLAATEAKYKQIKAEAERVIALYNDGGTTPNDYDKAVYGLQQIEAQYKHHKDELSYTNLYAPFEGYIHKCLFDEYETIGAGMPVISLLSKEVPEVEINLPAAEYVNRDKFTRYQCTFDIYPGKVFPLDLIGITHKANANQLYSMRLKLDSNNFPVPSAGMNTMVTIFYNENNDSTLQVPSSALLKKNGESSVFVYNPKSKIVKLCSVKCIRPLGDGKTIVTSSELKAGDIIVSAGIHSIKDGEKVSPISPVSNTNIGGLL